MAARKSNAGKTAVTVEHAGFESASEDSERAHRQGWGESLDRLAEDLAKAVRGEVLNNE